MADEPDIIQKLSVDFNVVNDLSIDFNAPQPVVVQTNSDAPVNAEFNTDQTLNAQFNSNVVPLDAQFGTVYIVGGGTHHQCSVGREITAVKDLSLGRERCRSDDVSAS